MRNFSLIGLLAVVAIIGWLSKGMLAPAVSHDPNNRATVEYWIAHNDARTTMLDYCQHNPQQQDTTDCQLATAAQMQIDSGSAQAGGGGGNSTQSQGSQSQGSQQRQGVDQGTGQASDELHAQQDSNAMDPGGR